MKGLLLWSVPLLCIVVHAATPAEWSQRSIYQIVTDRFNRSENDTAPCADWHAYCGRTFQGIIDQLDYIENLGFDAIWISPVVENQPD
jgi:alpha-amylase